MNKITAEDLIAKYAEGNCTEEEATLVEAGFLADYKLGKKEVPNEKVEEAVGRIQNSLKTYVANNPKTEKPFIRLWPRMIAAAVVIVTLSIGTYLYLNPLEVSKKMELSLSDISPGGNKAILTLADGSIINLNDNQDGIIIDKDAILYSDGSAITSNNTKLHVIPTEAEGAVGLSGIHPAKPTILALETPKGGQYQITLPDGTRVWLNSASKLKYPSRFNGNERRIELTGEAYFEVEKNATQPFIVQSSGQEVEVLGTHFNINAYADELNIKTTLLEGSVRVSGLSQTLTSRETMDLYTPNNSIILTPGEQSINSRSSIQVNKVDVDEAIGWKNGNFFFDRENFESAMRKIARWYDIEVVYESKVSPKIVLMGLISKKSNLSEVLNWMEKISNVNLEIEGRRVFVRK